MDKTLGLIPGRSGVPIPGRGKCSPRTIAVMARWNTYFTQPYQGWRFINIAELLCDEVSTIHNIAELLCDHAPTIRIMKVFTIINWRDKSVASVLKDKIISLPHNQSWTSVILFCTIFVTYLMENPDWTPINVST